MRDQPAVGSRQGTVFRLFLTGIHHHPSQSRRMILICRAALEEPSRIT